MSTPSSPHILPIDLGGIYPDLVGVPLEINGKRSLSARPDRYKQHGFHFNADNCIGCHACEAACAEKNNLPSHLAFRKVGFLEGGSYPEMVRINISMACNHCEDPVCLKGCPTLAYTKFVEYGAVLQDPDICFGCGYCTWVCPYNAPVLDPVRGEVQKCNMCVDRLEDGLKPSCVAACLSNALNFGVIGEVPVGQSQAKQMIIGFPDPAITRPNIRFQQTRSLPAQFMHAGKDPFLYEKDHPKDDHFHVRPISEPTKGWGLNQLHSREDSLVQFTLLYQMVMASFLLLFLFPKHSNVMGNIMTGHSETVNGMLCVLLGLQFLGMFVSTMHLGKPQFFYRAINNLRHSWISREILTTGTFFGLLAGYTGVTMFPPLTAWLPVEMASMLSEAIGWGATVMGPLGLYCMYRCYRIAARPFWNHWHTAGAFCASALILGSLVVGLILGGALWLEGSQEILPLLGLLAIPLVLGLILQAASLFFHIRHIKERGEEASVSYVLMTTRYGKTTLARLVGVGTLTLLSVIFTIGAIPSGGWGLVLWGTMWAAAIASEIVGRALFYVLVIPTTIPGAFFWGNKAFEAHARKTGLADLPQVGVIPMGH